MTLSKLTNLQYKAHKDFISAICRQAGVPQDAELLYHVDSLYRQTGGCVEEYVSEKSKPDVLKAAFELGMVELDPAVKLMTGKDPKSLEAQSIMADIAINAHARSYPAEESDKELLRQKILLWADPAYREEKVAEYEKLMISLQKGKFSRG